MDMILTTWLLEPRQQSGVPGSCRPPASLGTINPFMPTVTFNICCLRDCVSRHNGGTARAALKPLRDDSALRALSSLRAIAVCLMYTQRKEMLK